MPPSLSRCSERKRIRETYNEGELVGQGAKGDKKDGPGKKIGEQSVLAPPLAPTHMHAYSIDR